MVNPGISRDGKYPKNLEIGKYWEIRTLIKKDLLYFFFLLNFSCFIMLQHPSRFAIKMNCIGTLYKMKDESSQFVMHG